MEINTTETELTDNNLSLEEPHFVSQATVLSARPVVPLEVVAANSRSRTRLVIGLAIVLAIFIGAVGATWLFRLRVHNGGDSVQAGRDDLPQNTPPVEAGAAALHAPEAVTVTSPPAQRGNDIRARRIEQSKPEANGDSLNRAQIKPVRHVVTREEVAKQRDFEKERDRDQRREERRSRKIAKETRGKDRARESRRADDILRINEIFEGSRRPL